MGRPHRGILQSKSPYVKELLLVLTRTAESMGERDQWYTKQFAEFTTRLQMVADLEDLAQVRTSLMQRATELKNRVDQMAPDSNRSVAQLPTEVSTDEARLKTVEQLALRDSLTGLANRRKRRRSDGMARRAPADVLCRFS
jgi:hypothetical protein